MATKRSVSIDKQTALAPPSINSSYIRSRYLSSASKYAPEPPNNATQSHEAAQGVNSGANKPVAASDMHAGAPRAPAVPVPPGCDMPNHTDPKPQLQQQQLTNNPAVVSYEPSQLDAVKRDLNDIKTLLQAQSQKKRGRRQSSSSAASATKRKKSGSGSSGSRRKKKDPKMDMCGFYDYDCPSPLVPTFV